MTLIGYSGPPDDAFEAQCGTVDRSGSCDLRTFGTVRDGEASAAAFVRKESVFADEFDGEFVLSVRDGATLHLVRDAAGNRTCYYGRLSDGRWIASLTPRGVWSYNRFKRNLRPQAIAEYLTFSFIPGERTMLEGLYELPPGHRVELRSGEEPRLTPYFDPLDIEPGDPNADVWPAKFRSLLEEEVARRLTDAPALFLSGGLDSSIVCAEVARQSPRPVRTFSLHFGKKYPNELSFAREVAERCGTQHEELEIRPRRAVARLKEIVAALDEPVGDPVTMPNFELAAEVAGRGVTSVFNGEGGDPLFGGPKTIPMIVGEWYGHASREQRYLESYRRAFDELDRLPGRKLSNRIHSEELETLLTPFFERDEPYLHRLLAINTRLKGGHLILPKIERMLGANDVTPLSPLFTRRMIEMAFASPPDAKLQSGVDKWMMRRAYEADIPSSVLTRPKSGMRVPVHYWFRGPLRRYARRALSPFRVRRIGLLNADRVQQILKYDTNAARGRYGLKVWMLLTLDLWLREVRPKF